MEDAEDAAPSLKTGMGNVYCRRRFAIAGMQFYCDDRRRRVPRDLGTIAPGDEHRCSTPGRREGLADGPTESALRLPRVQAARFAALPTLHRFYAGLNFCVLVEMRVQD